MICIQTTKRIGQCAILAAGFFAASAYAQTPSVPSADESFMKDAADGGMDEVKLGQMAAQKASGARVKSFGQRMVRDHTRLNSQLQALAAKKNVKLPDGVGWMDKASNKMLSEKSGESFDKSYISSMLTDHKNDIKAFETEANEGKDPAVKAFAAKSLPMLRTHLKLAQDLAQSLGVTSDN
jgi:putative membrane protein